MRPDVAMAFDRLAAAARRDGLSLVVVSAFRTNAEQAVLFDHHPDPRWVAQPGHSLHRLGTELDLGPPAAYRWLAANAQRFHFVQRYSWEPWHYGGSLAYNASMSQNGPPWAGIVRVSVVGGRSGDSFHADRDQTAALQREADRRGVRLAVLAPELDVSGGLELARRPSLLAAVEGVERGYYAGIMVAYLSRLGRNVREQLAVWDRVEAAGGQILALAEGLDTSTPAGRFQRTVLLAVAEMELEMHRDRFDQLRAWATAAGVWQRRQTPLGYQRDPRTRRLTPDENADRVRQAFADRIRAVQISTIARNLRVSTSGCRYLLRNRVYLGELKVGDHLNPHAHPPLITEQAFLAAQHVKAPRPPAAVDRAHSLQASCDAPAADTS